MGRLLIILYFVLDFLKQRNMLLLLVEDGLILADAVEAVVNMVAMMVKVNAFKLHMLRISHPNLEKPNYAEYINIYQIIKILKSETVKMIFCFVFYVSIGIEVKGQRKFFVVYHSLDSNPEVDSCYDANARFFSIP